MAVAAITFDHLGTPAQMTALRNVLERNGVPATFFVTGEQAAADADGVRSLAAAGYEIGMHGWDHEQWSELIADDERARARRATDAIADALGRHPTGFRAPGGARTERTAGLLTELGYSYDASLGDGMTLARLAGGLPNVPFVWPGVDGYWYLRDQPEDPAVVRDAWLAALERSVERDRPFLTICHPEITGIEPARIAALDAVIAAAVADPRVELCTVGAIAARIPA
jgi:peptidoglycan/xylan/chitin deacetylase (PgdA/CDA1 family)